MRNDNYAEYQADCAKQRAEEQAAFLAAIKEGLAGCQHGTVSINSEESHFSWQPCDTCGTTLGGDREDATVLTFCNTTIDLEVCGDCAMYFANGDLPEEWRIK